MKKSALEKNHISESVTALVARLVKRIEWPGRRQAMADVALALLDGKARLAEVVFGWGRGTVELGLKEIKSGINGAQLREETLVGFPVDFRGFPLSLRDGETRIL